MRGAPPPRRQAPSLGRSPAADLSSHRLPAPRGAGATEQYHIHKSFVGFVILPIVGNAAEHATAITMAYKSKMDLSLGVALGSSTQIALFVVPVMILTAWAIGKELDLMFGAYETVITFVATVTVCFAVADGATNWLEVSGAERRWLLWAGRG